MQELIAGLVLTRRQVEVQRQPVRRVGVGNCVGHRLDIEYATKIGLPNEGNARDQIVQAAGRGRRPGDRCQLSLPLSLCVAVVPRPAPDREPPIPSISSHWGRRVHV